MTTTDLKPGEAWLIRVGDVEIPAIRCGSKRFPWSFVDEETGDRNAVDGTPLRRLVPEPTDWETLRTVADLLESHNLAGAATCIWLANQLEAEHAAAQAEAAADAAREALIEKAAKIQCDGYYGDGHFSSLAPTDGIRGRYIGDCARLADAGLLVDPEAEATA
ncbi:MAG: hypothetical protein WBA38_04235 [Gordonia sp. (in: high G+C Gram-positive bacteria)]|uniref:hypothetical protein n=1 Tax=Gordonia sp. (in: high G+C Gram-positive bacteria) TaxID=84139 RepID=UPI003C7876AD